MSLLPQRKKSPEEIAKLRESLGIPGTHADGEPAPAPEVSATAAEPVETIVPTHHEATVVHTAPAEPVETIVPAHHEATVVHTAETTHLDTQPAPPPAHGPKPVHSLKRSERIPAVPADDPAAEEPAATTPLPPGPKLVRSLRKSEQGPVLPAASIESAGDSNIPFHRHTDKEINEIRRREALAMMAPPANPRLAVAHPALLVPGYLLAGAGASCRFFDGFPMAATAGCAAAALLVAAFIFLKRPISRHHAAFIAVIALFVIVFGALHYFPHLRHAT